MLRTYVTPDKPFHTTDVQKEKSLKNCTLILLVSWELYQYHLKALVFTINLCLHKNVFDSLMLIIPFMFSPNSIWSRFKKQSNLDSTVLALKFPG